MDAAQVRAAAVARFGPGTREIGPGTFIPRCDVAGGVLEVNRPTFRSALGCVFWLVHTRNPAGVMLAQPFEMFTPPDPHNHGTAFWIGDVDLDADHRDRHTDRGSNLKDHGDQSGNFFVNHPSITFRIVWSARVDAGTLGAHG